MKCPICVDEGERSTLTGGTGVTTCMGWTAYYDEDGKHHSHDPNSHSASYRCSRGHDVFVSWVQPCSSCDYGKDSEIIRADAPTPAKEDA